jgi:hypothetical protein
MPDSNSNRLVPYYELVELVIGGLGAPIEDCRVKDKNDSVVTGQWNLQKGSATIYVDVYATNDGYAYFCIASPVMCIVTPKLKELYEKLLILNHDMYAASFSIHEGWVWIRILRECDGMDEQECRASFDRVGTYADKYDDELKNEFGG